MDILPVNTTHLRLVKTGHHLVLREVQTTDHSLSLRPRLLRSPLSAALEGPP